MPDAAVMTVENDFEYPFDSMVGTSILHCMAASARLDPDKPPMRVESRMLTCASPPGILAVSTSQQFIMRLVTPV